MLEINHISVKFSADSDVQAVEDVSLRLADGEKLALVGETGSGKSVLLLAVLVCVVFYIFFGRYVLNNSPMQPTLINITTTRPANVVIIACSSRPERTSS